MTTIKTNILQKYNDICVSDIMYFFEQNSKSENDITNKIRENILKSIIHIPDSFISNNEYGEKWFELKGLFELTLKLLCPCNYKSVNIVSKGGMKYNYDFEAQYINDLGDIIYEVKIEFKNNNNCVLKLPQFLELYDSDCKTKYNIFPYSYSEFYYDNYLDKYIKLDKNLILEKPSKDIYLQYIKDINYKHPFFNQLYINKHNFKKEKDEIVNESKQQFIYLYSHCFRFDKLSDKIRDSQTNKVYLLWDKNEMHTDVLDVKNIKISGIKPNTIKKMCFDLDVNNFIYDICVRLNWGNNNGIANPRWKFTFINK
uniref:Uncharacterized protein n=1 Tax=viral metagenome TaxID=1070528 RepID=A0A6C0IRM3_9ZZZZ